MASCKARTLAGTPCRAPAQNNSDYCFRHDPDKHAQQVAASSDGGRHSNYTRSCYPWLRLQTQQSARDRGRASRYSQSPHQAGNRLFDGVCGQHDHRLGRAILPGIGEHPARERQVVDSQRRKSMALIVTSIPVVETAHAVPGRVMACGFRSSRRDEMFISSPIANWTSPGKPNK
jgi:hypothetical protein